MADSGENAKGFEFRKFATPRIIGGIAIAVIVLWALIIIFGSSDAPTSHQYADRQAAHTPVAAPERSLATDHSAAGPATVEAPAGKSAAGHPPAAGQAHLDTHAAAPGAPAAHGTAADRSPAPTTDAVPARQSPSPAHPVPAADSGHAAPATRPAAAPAADAAAPVHKPMPKGVAFVEATIAPLRFELEERWWGWRPNDILDVTDNVNNFQLGVLEVTRRTAVALAERISRTGVTDALDPNLEDAMNWFMVKATSYWFPSPESKYREGLQELDAYLNRLKDGRATFYTRADNLIPLLSSFEDLLGSCDENLVKQLNEDGTEVSIFNADDYFFYTRGVANSMATVLEAVHHDFLPTLESRHAAELLHHAIVSCQRAAELDPWIILDRDLSSVFANHRANMAAPISHARFYLGQLVKTLST